MTATEATLLDAQQLAVLLDGQMDPGGSRRVEVLHNDAEVAFAASNGWELSIEAGRIRIESTDIGFLDSMSEVLTAIGWTTHEVEEVHPDTDPTATSDVVAVFDADTMIATIRSVNDSGRAERPDAHLGDGGLLSLGMLRDVPLEVSAELGKTRMSVADVLQLRVGSLIQLDRAAGAPVDVIVNGASIAKGEVVVIDEEYGVRITDILGRVSDKLQ